MSAPFDAEIVIGAFPGQGAYYPGALEGLDGHATLAEIDAVAHRLLGRSLTGTVLGAGPAARRPSTRCSPMPRTCCNWPPSPARC